MEGEKKPKKLVDAATVVEAITTVEWSDVQTKRFNKNNIFRLSEDQIKQVLPEFWSVYSGFHREYTLLQNIIIRSKETIVLKSTYNFLPDIYMSGCEIFNIDISDCHWDNNTNANFLPETTSLTISNCILNNINISGKSKIGDFDIKESTVGDFIVLDGSEIGCMLINNDSVVGDFNVGDKSSMDFFIIYSANSIGDFYIFNDSVVGDFDIENCLLSNFLISNSKVGDFEAYGAELGSFRISDESSIGKIVFDQCYVGNFTMKKSTSKLLEVKKCIISFSFDRAAIGQCKILMCQIFKLHILNQCEMELYVSGGQIDHLNFKQLTLGRNSIISLSSLQIYLCNMFEFTVLGSLYFRDVKNAKSMFSDILLHKGKPLFIKYIDDDYNRTSRENNSSWESYYSKVVKYNRHIKELKSELKEKITSTFRIVKSSLSKTEFTECDLRGFNLEYKNSRLIDVYINGGELPNEVEIYGEEQLPKILDQQKSFFDQLKKMFENHGDIVRSTFYRAKAAEIQTKISWLEKNYWEWLVYKINEISNSHGVSWLRALGFTLGLSLIGFIFYNAAFEARQYEFVYSFNLDWIGHWAYFTLPIHKINFMGEPTSEALFVDVLFRIFVGYGIYQFIFAFRKHGKR